MTDILTSEQIATLSTEIDSQLRELRAGYDSGMKNLEPETPESLPVKQSQTIEQITKEKPESFLLKFGRAAKSDLCEEGGLLNTQWKKWADLNNQDVVEKFAVILVAMGFSGNALQVLIVALAVIVIHIGVKAFCEDYSQ